MKEVTSMNKIDAYKSELDTLHPSDELISSFETMSAGRKKSKKHTVKTITSVVAVFLVVILAGGTTLATLFSAKSADRAENMSAQTQTTGGNGAFAELYSYKTDKDDNKLSFENYFEEADKAPNESEEEDRAFVPIDSRKLIKDAYLSLNTKDFDKFSASLEQLTESLGGYTESSNITTSSYDGHRFGDIVLRIPSEHLDSFLNSVSGQATVTNKTVNVRDVTTTYIDTASRIKALETEQSTLLDILDKAQSLSDVLEIQGRLTQVRSELEFMKSQLSSLDEQISYSKVTFSVTEVDREQPVVKEGFFSEVLSKLRKNFYSISDSLREGAIWFLSSLPYFILILIPVAIIIIVVKIIRRKRVR